MALLMNRRLLTAKIESTYNTDPVPTGTDSFQVRELNLTPLEADVVSRDLIRPYLGSSPQLLAQTRVSVSVTTELAGSGTAGVAPRYGALLKACGMSETVVANTSVTYAPVSSGFSSVTMYVYQDSILHKITGARGTFSISGELNQIPVITFQMTGIYNDPVDGAAPTPTYTNQAEPDLFKDPNTSAFELFGYSGCLQSASFDMANDVIYRSLIGCNEEVMITNRRPNGNVIVEATSIATKDYFADAVGTGFGNLTFQHGGTAGNIVTFTSDRIDLGAPTYSESDGIMMLNMPYVATPDTGNDEMELVFT